MKNILKRKLGRSGIEVSAMGLGCWAIGGPMSLQGMPLGWSKVDDNESLKALDAGINMGVNFLDTADMYGTGHSEKIIGKAIKGRRDKLIIATKFGFVGKEGSREIESFEGDGSPEYIRKAVEGSLKRLGTDYIDLYQFHLNTFPLDKAEATREVLEELVQKGKIRAYAWSTDFLDRAELFEKGENCTAVQHVLNIFSGNQDILKLCEEKNMASINRCPLAMGLLTGKFTQNTSFPADDVRSIGHMLRDDVHIFFEEGGPDKVLLKKLEAIQEILRSNSRTLVQGALGWLWGFSPNTVPIPGFKTVKQVEENAAALQFGPLDKNQMDEIASILS
ncbi:MAG: aldo/keto reductase [Draconibacterium sp.]|nr:aldo/keto reductase [Draconibacterium sp.]